MSRLSVLAPCEIMMSLLSLFLPLLRLKQNCKMFCLGGVVLFKSPGCLYPWRGHVLIVAVLISLPLSQSWSGPWHYLPLSLRSLSSSSGICRRTCRLTEIWGVGLGHVGDFWPLSEIPRVFEKWQFSCLLICCICSSSNSPALGSAPAASAPVHAEGLLSVATISLPPWLPSTLGTRCSCWPRPTCLLRSTGRTASRKSTLRRSVSSSMMPSHRPKSWLTSRISTWSESFCRETLPHAWAWIRPADGLRILFPLWCG